MTNVPTPPDYSIVQEFVSNTQDALEGATNQMRDNDKGSQDAKDSKSASERDRGSPSGGGSSGYGSGSYGR